MSGELNIAAVEIGGEETPLVILFKRQPDGTLVADVKGWMDPRELVDQLRFIADHIAGTL